MGDCYLDVQNKTSPSTALIPSALVRSKSNPTSLSETEKAVFEEFKIMASVTRFQSLSTPKAPIQLDNIQFFSSLPQTRSRTGVTPKPTAKAVARAEVESNEIVVQIPRLDHGVPKESIPSTRQDTDEVNKQSTTDSDKGNTLFSVLHRNIAAL